MVELRSEVIESQSRSTLLHRYELIYFKLLLVLLTLVSRAVGTPMILALVAFNSALLIYVGGKKLFITSFISWCALTLLILLLNTLFSTFRVEIFVNLLYGFTTFTSFALFYLTTTPAHVRKLVGFNVVSLTYLYFGHSTELLLNTIYVLRARGLSISHRELNFKYVLRAFSTLLVTRIVEAEEALRARGVED